MKIKQSFRAYAAPLLGIASALLGIFGRPQTRSEIVWYGDYFEIVEVSTRDWIFWGNIWFLVALILSLVSLLLWNMIVDEDEIVVRLGFLPTKRIDIKDIDGIVVHRKWIVRIYKKDRRSAAVAFISSGDTLRYFLNYMEGKDHFSYEPSEFRALRKARRKERAAR